MIATWCNLGGTWTHRATRARVTLLSLHEPIRTESGWSVKIRDAWGVDKFIPLLGLLWDFDEDAPRYGS